MKKRNWGIIGLGAIAQKFSEAFIQTTNSTLLAISSNNSQKLENFKRQFFIENSDLFSGFGNNREARPFFSRRIGIAKDKDGNNIENKIIAGLRLSGKINNDW